MINNTRKPIPYIGVTGFKTVEDVQRIAPTFLEIGPPYTGMVGFLSSANRLGDLSVGGRISPAVNSLRSLVESVPRTLIPMIHFAAARETVYESVSRLFSVNNLYESCQAVQLNVDWPSIGSCERLRNAYNDMNIVLQVPQRAMTGKSQNEIVDLVCAYDGLASYVLIDPSGGKGTEFDLKNGAELLSALDSNLERMRVGIAGGFCSENVSDRVKYIREFVPQFCIDAQGRLIVENNLDYERTIKYVTNASKAFT